MSFFLNNNTYLHIIIIWTASNFWHVLYDMTELLNETRIVSFSINNYDYDLWNLPQQSSPNQNKQPMSTLSSILLHTWAREFWFFFNTITSHHMNYELDPYSIKPYRHVYPHLTISHTHIANRPHHTLTPHRTAHMHRTSHTHTAHMHRTSHARTAHMHRTSHAHTTYASHIARTHRTHALCTAQGRTRTIRDRASENHTSHRSWNHLIQYISILYTHKYKWFSLNRTQISCFTSKAASFHQGTLTLRLLTSYFHGTPEIIKEWRLLPPTASTNDKLHKGCSCPSHQQ